MSKTAQGVKNFIRRMGRRQLAPIEEDETMVMINPEATPNSKYRSLPIGVWEPLLKSENILAGVSAVFPAGIFLRLASNANTFHIELILDAPMFQAPFSVVVPPSGAVYDLQLLPAPDKGGPRSEEWCTMFGVITRENLSGGIVERRENGTMVVYRTFRTKRDTLTPFGLYFTKDPLRVSESDLMVISNDDFENLLKNCSGADAASIRVMAKPLLDKDQHLITEGNTIPLHVQMIHPVVLTVPPPPLSPRTEESLI